ncbi:MAG: hypothetical protein PHH12_01445 [Candidatus Shapirobacteria bacterium]|nr:hypothetical protein [Candidatus Shapirobacteria bacterium]
MKEISKNIENNFKKGIPVYECVQKAESLIKKNGTCLFLFDVKNSKKYSTEDRQKLQYQLKNMITEMNIEFDEYFPKNNLATETREEKGFYSLFGDSSWAGINNSEIIPKMVDFIYQKCPEFSFHFNIARDGYDQEAMKTVK